MTYILDSTFQAEPDANVSMGQRKYRNAEDSPHKELNERALWVAYMDQKVADALGNGHANGYGKGASSKKWCYECHFDDLTCGCYTLLADKVTVSGFNPDKGYLYVGRHKRTVSLRSTRLFPDGHKYYRALRPRCPNIHTIQQCAKSWIASKDCDELCFQWDMDARAYRKMVGI